MSRERRCYVPKITDRVVLEGDEAHHLRRVLRLGVGDEVVLFDGRGRAERAVVTAVSRSTATLERCGEAPSRESPLALDVAVAVPKAERMALAVRELTELGVTRILPLVTDRGEVPAQRIEASLERWRRIAVEACKQCGRSAVPEISPARGLESVLAGRDATSLVLVPHPGAHPLDLPEETSRSVLVLVGPEGGWSDTEVSLLTGQGARLFDLGPRTLRTETAAIVSATLFQWHYGDLRRR